MTASDQRDRADVAAGLIGLSEAIQPEELPELATFTGPPSLTSQTLKVERLSKLCPPHSGRGDRGPDQPRRCRAAGDRPPGTRRRPHRPWGQPVSVIAMGRCLRRD
jgi:hypothetical protein